MIEVMWLKTGVRIRFGKVMKFDPTRERDGELLLCSVRGVSPNPWSHQWSSAHAMVIAIFSFLFFHPIWICMRKVGERVNRGTTKFKWWWMWSQFSVFQFFFISIREALLFVRQRGATQFLDITRRWKYSVLLQVSTFQKQLRSIYFVLRKYIFERIATRKSLYWTT